MNEVLKEEISGDEPRPHYTKAGLPPGTLVHIGRKRTDKINISVIDYQKDAVEEFTVEKIDQLEKKPPSDVIRWINIDGIHSAEMLSETGRYFEIHPLVMEDIMNTGQRPKMEDYGRYIFFTLKMVYIKPDNTVQVEHISLILGRNYLITFQEMPGDVFEPVRRRIRENKGQIRITGADYLAYSLLDAVVDNYFILMDRFSDRIEELEDAVEAGTGPEYNDRMGVEINSLRKEIIFIRRFTYPLREAISNFQRSGSSLIDRKTEIYLADVKDHVYHFNESIESFRDMLNSIFEIFLSTTSNRLNEVMKVLAVIATIFMPLTLIAGIYGMNFKYMPELEWRWGYFAVMGLMLFIGLSMLYYFRKKKWF